MGSCFLGESLSTEAWRWVGNQGPVDHEKISSSKNLVEMS
jgi:hypothetical protein